MNEWIFLKIKCIAPNKDILLDSIQAKYHYVFIVLGNCHIHNIFTHDELCMMLLLGFNALLQSDCHPMWYDQAKE